MKCILTFLSALIFPFSISNASAEWLSLPANEVPKPELCDYRVLVNFNPDESVSSYSINNLSQYSTDSLLPYNQSSINMYFSIENSNRYHLISLIEPSSKAIFQKQYYSMNTHDTKCTLHLSANYVHLDRRKITSRLTGSNWRLSCYSVPRGSTDGFGIYDNAYDVMAPVRLQKNCSR